MIKYTFTYLFLVLISSCTNREERETHLLMEALFERELDHRDSIFMVEDAYTEWFSHAGSKTCDWEWLDELFDDWEGRKPVNLSEIYTPEEVDKICRDGMLDYTFQQNKLPGKIKLIPRNQIEEMTEEFNKMVEVGGPILISKQMERLRIYHEISKPVFTRNYQYAFVYRATHCFPMACLGPAVFILKKENGKWRSLYGADFFLI